MQGMCCGAAVHMLLLCLASFSRSLCEGWPCAPLPTVTPGGIKPYLMLTPAPAPPLRHTQVKRFYARLPHLRTDSERWWKARSDPLLLAEVLQDEGLDAKWDRITGEGGGAWQGCVKSISCCDSSWSLALAGSGAVRPAGACRPAVRVP
jgi:hypothetical protein